MHENVTPEDRKILDEGYRMNDKLVAVFATVKPRARRMAFLLGTLMALGIAGHAPKRWFF